MESVETFIFVLPRFSRNVVLSDYKSIFSDLSAASLTCLLD